MSLGKSIEKRIPLIIYVLLIINLTSIVLLFIFPKEIVKLILFIDLLLNVFMPTLFINPKKAIFIIKVFLLTNFLYLILAISFRDIRSIFPNFGRDKSIVGFAQYFNYPIYFDIFLFVVILIIPFASYFLIRRFK